MADRQPREAGAGGGRGRGHLIVVAVAWVALTALLELLVQLIVADGFPLVAADEGDLVDTSMLFLLRMAVPVFAFVLVVVIYSALRFRVPTEDEAASAVQHRGERRFSWGWVGVTSGLTVLVIIYPGITELQAIRETRSAPDPLTVNVTASQWQWRFAYPGQRLPDQRELVLPAGRPVRFVLRSRDVIHGFWVPAFRIKEDVVPGERRDVFLTPNRRLSTTMSPLARVQCAELCGVGHANMQAPVRVVSPAAFSAWVRAQGGISSQGKMPSASGMSSERSGM